MAIIDSIRERYMLGSQPKKYLYGQYGAGKTHTLFNIKYHLEESPEAKSNAAYEVRCCPMDGEFKEKTDYSYLHAQMMEAVTLEAVERWCKSTWQTTLGPNWRRIFVVISAMQTRHEQFGHWGTLGSLLHYGSGCAVVR